MKKYLSMLKQVKAEYGMKALLDAWSGAIVFSLLVFVPIYVILVELLIVYMYKLYTFAVLLVIATLFLNITFHSLTKKALLLKKPEANAPIKQFVFINMLTTTCFLLIVGLVVLFVMIPIWLV